jgi:hypothetical protein
MGLQLESSNGTLAACCETDDLFDATLDLVRPIQVQRRSFREKRSNRIS